MSARIACSWVWVGARDGVGVEVGMGVPSGDIKVSSGETGVAVSDRGWLEATAAAASGAAVPTLGLGLAVPDHKRPDDFSP